MVTATFRCEQASLTGESVPVSKEVEDVVGEDTEIGAALQRILTEIDEIAEAAIFISSPSAGYITGTILDCDGGSQLGDASRQSLERGMA